MPYKLVYFSFKKKRHTHTYTNFERFLVELRKNPLFCYFNDEVN